MKYQRLLLTRTRYKDYRWILTSDLLSSDDLRRIWQLFSSYVGNYRSIYARHNVSPLLFLAMPKARLLVKCGITNYQDEFGRPIYALEGIAVPGGQGLHLRFSLPWLLSSHGSILDSLTEIDFNSLDTDKLSNSIQARGFSFEELDELPFGVTPKALPYTTAEKVVQFSENGLHELIDHLSCPDSFVKQFGFGVIAEMMDLIGETQIVAKADMRSWSRVANEGKPPNPNDTALPATKSSESTQGNQNLDRRYAIASPTSTTAAEQSNTDRPHSSVSPLEALRELTTFPLRQILKLVTSIKEDDTSSAIEQKAKKDS